MARAFPKNLINRNRGALSALALEVRTALGQANYLGPTISAGSAVPTATEPDGSGYLRAGSATSCIPLTFGGVLAELAATAAVTNTVNTEQTFGTPYSIEAGRLKTGQQIIIEGHGEATATAGTDTLTYKVYIGSNAIITSAAVDAATNDKFAFRFVGTILNAGASAKLYGFAVYTDLAGTSFKIAHTANGGLALDTTAALAVKATGTWSATTATNTATLDHFTLRIEG